MESPIAEFLMRQLACGYHFGVFSGSCRFCFFAQPSVRSTDPMWAQSSVTQLQRERQRTVSFICRFLRSPLRFFVATWVHLP